MYYSFKYSITQILRIQIDITPENRVTDPLTGGAANQKTHPIPWASFSAREKVGAGGDEMPA